MVGAKTSRYGGYLQIHNKQLWTANIGWSSSLDIGEGATNTSW